MKRSEFSLRIPRLIITAHDLDNAIAVAEAAGVTWDPEEPEGFREWWIDYCTLPGRPTASESAMAAWNAALARQQGRQKAQERTSEPQPDPEARRKEIEAEIEEWVHDSRLPVTALLDRLKKLGML